MSLVQFSDIARLPTPDDNVAIATRPIDAGTQVQLNGETFVISHSILEGHRFAASTLAEGEFLCSWGLPFGKATRAIAPGEYVCNAKILDALRERHVEFEIPTEANFDDYMQKYVVDPETFTPGVQIDTKEQGEVAAVVLVQGGELDVKIIGFANGDWLSRSNTP